MTIIWYGQSCFQIITNQNKDHQVKMVIDPFDESVGIKPPLTLKRGEFDILLITHPHPDHSNIKAVGGQPFVISGPGEYDIKNVFLQGFPGYHDSEEGRKRGEITIYTIQTEEMRVCHLGDLGQKTLTDEQLEKIGDIDILMIPIGGVYTIDGLKAKDIIGQIEPKIVIPMHYQIPRVNLKLDSLNKFLRVMGKKTAEALEKLTIKKKDLPVEGPEVIILKP